MNSTDVINTLINLLEAQEHIKVEYTLKSKGVNSEEDNRICNSN